ncbi:MAG: MCM DNA helicase complex subunit mcm6 [Alyxoria varia]|nr:MAG: MCM DNA helicase complex subunit mcm6 [Alyxoria varia]
MAGKKDTGSVMRQASQVYGIQKKRKCLNRCAVNVLPCRINHDGPSNASTRYWNPREAPSGERVAYFRGRKLHGGAITTPEDYQGVVLRKTERKMEVHPGEALTNGEKTGNSGYGAAVQDDSEPFALAMEEIASFENIVTWGHDSLPENQSDPYKRGISEWIEFAKTVSLSKRRLNHRLIAQQIHSSIDDERAEGLRDA